jgi:hypothetical protein
MKGSPVRVRGVGFSIHAGSRASPHRERAVCQVLCQVDVDVVAAEQLVPPRSERLCGTRGEDAAPGFLRRGLNRSFPGGSASDGERGPWGRPAESHSAFRVRASSQSGQGAFTAFRLRPLKSCVRRPLVCLAAGTWGCESDRRLAGHFQVGPARVADPLRRAESASFGLSGSA